MANAHPTTDVLLDVAELGDAAHVDAPVRAHLASCASCRDEVESIRQMLVEVSIERAGGIEALGSLSIDGSETPDRRRIGPLLGLAAAVLLAIGASMFLTLAMVRGKLHSPADPVGVVELGVESPPIRFGPPSASGEAAGGAVNASVAGAFGLPRLDLRGTVQVAGAFQLPDTESAASELPLLAAHRAAREQFNRGLEAQRGGEPGVAIDHYRAALTLQADLVPALRNLGIAHLQAGDQAAAASVFRRLVELGLPLEADTHRAAGVAFYESGSYDLAAIHLEAFASAQPDNALARVQLGMCLAKLRRLGDASGHYREAIAADPDLVIAHFAVGAYYAALAESTEPYVVRALLQEVRHDDSLRAIPGVARLMREVADGSTSAAAELSASLREAMLEREADAYAMAAAAPPGTGRFEALFNLGVVQVKRGRFDAALDAFCDAVRLQPDSAEAWYNLGITAGRVGNAQVAEDSLFAVIRLQPRHERALRALGLLYRATGQEEKLRDHVATLRLLAPELVLEFESN